MGVYSDICIIIPSLNPDDKMLELLKELAQEQFENIIVVNDGSAGEYDKYFSTAEKEYGCTVLKHYVNMGKGRALKNAFNYALNSFPDLCGVITADSDGQHSVKDIVRCAKLLLKERGTRKMFLGARDFNADGIPARSRFGNKVTSRVLSAFCDISVTDTQTGLRGITKAALADMLNLYGERYEYEMNMIIESKEKDISLEEYPIDTIYIEENASSHFNPIVDSFKIYKQFFKYIFASLSSFVIDILFFMLFSALLKKNEVAAYIVLATYGARMISSVYNFCINKKVVFKSEASVVSSAVKYFLLCIVQGTLSAFLVQLFYSHAAIAEPVCKMIVDTLLFFASFFIQKKVVFREGKR